MAHAPLKLSIDDAHAELTKAWRNSYSPEAIAHAVNSIADQPVPFRINILVSRLFFRGIYFPLMKPLDWVKLLFSNRRTIFGLINEGFTNWPGGYKAVEKEVLPAPTLASAEE